MRAVTLKGFTELASSLGIDGFAVLRAAAVHPSDLKDPEKRVPAKAVLRVLERAAKAAACPTFGLKMATKRSFEDLGPISLLMQHLPNLLAVIEASARLRRHYNDLLIVSVESEGRASFVRWDLQVDEGADQACDLGLGLAYQLLRGASQGSWQPTKVFVAHSALSASSTWEEFFRCPVEFNSSANGFSCPTSSLEAQSPLANEVMARHACHLLKFVEPADTGKTYEDRVRRLIRLMIPEGTASLVQVAKHLDLKPRTLQRHLAAEDCKFEDLLEEEKMEQVRKGLTNPALSLGMISEALGYSSLSAFSRWFNKKTGQSPSSWRKLYSSELEGRPPPVWKP